MNETTNEHAWGRVDENKTVYVRDGDTEREVGQFPDGTPEEALAYYVRKFNDFEGQVTLLEARIARGVASGDVAQTVAHLQEQLVEPAAVGDIASLRARVEALSERAGEFTQKQREERDAARAEALAAREVIVTEAEGIAAGLGEQTRWKDTGEAFEQLFQRWQEAQRNGVTVSKGQADALWKRFRAARNTFDTARRAYFSKLDSANKDVKHAKERLIAQAEALAPRGADGIPAYRALLDEWKLAGRASRKIDDQLWEKFKAAGDVLYQAKAAEAAVQDAEYAANLTVKEALLAEHRDAILSEKDRTVARKKLTQLQLAWDDAGRVPRDSLREIENRLRQLEDHVKKLEDEHWQQTNPETKARSEGLRGQLEESIAKLEQEIREAADETTRAAAEQKLETQKSWLAALGD